MEQLKLLSNSSDNRIRRLKALATNFQNVTDDILHPMFGICHDNEEIQNVLKNINRTWERYKVPANAK